MCGVGHLRRICTELNFRSEGAATVCAQQSQGKPKDVWVLMYSSIECLFSPEPKTDDYILLILFNFFRAITQSLLPYFFHLHKVVSIGQQRERENTRRISCID